MTRAILDAGPLIHLGELDALDALSDVAHAPSAELQTVASALSLDQGEVEALALMEMYPSAIFLTDDAAARLAAEQRGYRVHGTIGLLIRSVRTGCRKPQEVLHILRALPQRSSLFIRPNLLATIIERLEKEWAKNP